MCRRRRHYSWTGWTSNICCRCVGKRSRLGCIRGWCYRIRLIVRWTKSVWEWHESRTSRYGQSEQDYYSGKLFCTIDKFNFCSQSRGRYIHFLPSLWTLLVVRYAIGIVIELVLISWTLSWPVLYLAIGEMVHCGICIICKTGKWECFVCKLDQVCNN